MHLAHSRYLMMISFLPFAGIGMTGGPLGPCVGSTSGGNVYPVRDAKRLLVGVTYYLGN